MDYKFIENARLRRLMQKARHKRKVLDNPNRIPEHKNAKIIQKSLQTVSRLVFAFSSTIS